jgi:hypothetical protein
MAVANDHPFRKGDHVAIIRTRRGWLDGTADGKVIHRDRRSTGTYFYTVRTRDGVNMEVEHTRDLSEAIGYAPY